MDDAPSVAGPDPAGLPRLRAPRAPSLLTRAEQHLHLHLQRFSYCLDRYGVRFARPEAAPSVDESGRRVATISDEIDALDVYLREVYPEDDLPLRRLARRFGFEDAPLHVLVAAAAPALDLTLARRMAALAGRAQPEAGFIIDALAGTLDEERTYRAALRSSSALCRWRLVRLGEARDWAPETPLFYAGLLVPERVLDWLRGDVGFDAERFDRSAVLRSPDEALTSEGRAAFTPPGAPISDDASVDAVDAVAAVPSVAPVAASLFRTLGGRHLPLCVTGPALVGKASAVIAAAAAAGRLVLDVDLDAVAEAPDPSALLLDLGREAMLRDALLLLRHGDGLGERSSVMRRAAVSLVAGGALPVAVTLRETWSEVLHRVPGAQQIRLEMPGEGAQLAHWKRALPPTVTRAADLDLEGLIRRYHLTPGDIALAGAAACSDARARGPEAPLHLDDVVTAIRGRLRHRLGDVAELMSTTLGWDDAVLPPPVQSRITELISTIHHRAQVMDDWGFSQKISYGRSVSALFSGPPGTGKTMVATLIAKELGFELFRVDLSRVMSKWVGETEKNLGRAFDEAKNSQAVLLFDEADALFAKRTDVKSSNDRYANLEVNYLLQRLESFDGIVLLTTNNQSSIDDAFRRRLRFRIDFPTPDRDERARLWRTLFPASAPLAADVSFEELADAFEMSGGYIKNAVVRAAFLAAADGQRSITHDVVVRAAELEWEEMGRL